MDNDTPGAAKGEASNMGPAGGNHPGAGDLVRGMASLAAAKDAGHGGASATDKASRPMLPVTESFHPLSAAEPKERAGVFTQLVTDDGDIAGLVAYSIYKQNKLDWLSAFEAAKGRQPTDDELASYIIGEGTPRRIAIYRHLAEATLAGNGPSAGKTGSGPRVGLRTGPLLADKTTMIATYTVIALVFLIGFLLAAHYTMSSR